MSIEQGAYVSGFGLAVTTMPTAASATVFNSGVVSVSTNNVPTAGGWNNAAIAINSSGGSNYQGLGSAYNFGYGDALGIYESGGSANASIWGGVTAYHGNAISLYNTGPSESYIFTDLGAILRSTGGAGILMQSSGGGGNMAVQNNASILSAGGPNSLYSGMFLETYGPTGNVFIENYGKIGSASDRAQNYGIIVGMNNASTIGTLGLFGGQDAAIYSRLDGIYLASNGLGQIEMRYWGDINSSAGSGIHVRSNNPALNYITVATDNPDQTIRAANVGILAEAAGTGPGGLGISNDATILSSGAPNSLQVGISASSSGNSNVGIWNYGSVGSVDDRVFNGLVVQNTGGGATGSNYVENWGSIHSIGDGVKSSSNTNYFTMVWAGGVIDSLTGDGVDVQTTSGETQIAVEGSVTAAGAGGKGINAVTETGHVYVLVDKGGNVASAASDGIAISSVDASTQAAIQGTVTAAGGGIGVNASSQNGYVQVFLLEGGNVTSASGAGVAISSGSAMDVYLQRNSAITGTTAILGGGTGAFKVGNSGTIGAGGGKAVVASRANASSRVDNRGGAVLNGSVELTDHDDVIYNEGTWQASGLNQFYQGRDSITNTGLGIINTESGTRLYGLESFVNKNTLATSGSLTFDSATSLDNSGKWFLSDGAGVSGLGVLSNSGGVFVEGLAKIGSVQLNNSGAVNLADRSAAGVFTLTGDYVGSGSASLFIDAGSTDGDKFVIIGAASGTTSVYVDLSAPIARPLLVVDTGTSTADAFVLGGDLGGSPLFDVELEQAGFDYYLTSTPSALALRPLTLGSRAQDMWLSSAGASLDNAMQHRAEVKAMRGKGLGFWNYDGQSGIDFMAPKGNLVAGLTSTVIGNRGSQNGEALEAKGNSVGAYLLLGDPAGLHGSLIAKRDWSEGDLGHSVFAGMRPDTTSTGIEGELAKGFKLGSVNLDAEAGLAYVHTDVDGFSKTVGRMTVAYDFDSVESLRGNLGLKASFGGPLAPFVSARLSQEFMGDRKMTLTSGDYAETVKRDGSDTSLRLEAGLGSPGNSGAMLTGWVEGGRDKTAGVRGRFRF